MRERKSKSRTSGRAAGLAARWSFLKLDRGHFSHGCGPGVALDEIFDHYLSRRLRTATELLLAAAQNRHRRWITHQQPRDFVILAFDHQPDLPPYAFDFRQIPGRVSIGLWSIPPRHNFFWRGAFARVRLGLGGAQVRNRVLFHAIDLAGVLLRLTPALGCFPIEPL